MLGTLIYAHTGIQASLIRALHEDIRTWLLDDGGWRGQCSWVFTTCVFGWVKCRKGPEPSQQLVTLRRKAKKSVHVEAKRTRNSSKLESMHWRVYTSQVLGSLLTLTLLFGLPLNQQHTISDTCSECSTRMLNAHGCNGALARNKA